MQQKTNFISSLGRKYSEQLREPQSRTVSINTVFNSTKKNNNPYNKENSSPKLKERDSNQKEGLQNQKLIRSENNPQNQQIASPQFNRTDEDYTSVSSNGQKEAQSFRCTGDSVKAKQFKLQINHQEINQFINQRTISLQQLLIEREIELETLQKKIIILEQNVEGIESEGSKSLQKKTHNQLQNQLQEEISHKKQLLTQLDSQQIKLSEQEQNEYSFKKMFQVQLQILQNELFEEKKNNFEQQQTFQQCEVNNNQLKFEIKTQNQELCNLKESQSQNNTKLFDNQINSKITQTKLIELQNKLNLSEENSNQLKQLLNEKLFLNNKLTKQIQDLQQFEEENQGLQHDLFTVKQTYDIVHKENRNVVKLLQQQLIQYKNSNEKLQLQYQEANLITQDGQKKMSFLEGQIKHLVQQNQILEEELKNNMEDGLEDKLSTQKKFQDIILQNDTLKQDRDRLNSTVQEQGLKLQQFRQSEQTMYDQVRTKVELQANQFITSEKQSLERLIYQNQEVQIHQQLQTYSDMNNQISFLMKENSEQKLEKEILLLEVADAKQSLTSIKTLEQQVRVSTSEIEKLKQQSVFHQQIQQQTQKNQQISGLMQYQTSYQQMTSYIKEIETTLDHQIQENKRLNGVIMDRCKNNW